MFEKEAEEWADKMYPCDGQAQRYLLMGAEFGYNKGKAETALLSQHILDLQKDKGNLTDRVRELEQQIEKMKRCEICKHYQGESCNYHSLSEKDCKANNHSLFELVGDKRK